MSTLKHTPGPWRRGSDDFASIELFCEIYAPNDLLIGKAHTPPLLRGKDRLESLEYARGNAALMAAAPDLLEALQAAEKALNNIRVCCHHTAWEATGPAVIAARAAIAKATGQEGGAA